MADLTVTGLRVLREVAERGSFSAAARSLGYTQSAVSRQIAALETIAGRRLFERGRDGVRPTPAGGRLLVRAARVLGEVDAAVLELADPGPAQGPVRLGAFATATAALVPAALADVAAEFPAVRVTLREAATPALVRALRAGTLDLAVVAATPPYRPLDDGAPALEATVLSEGELLVAVGPGHPFAGRDVVDVAELEGQRWVAGPSQPGETLLGAWPGLPGRPDVPYAVRDWLSRIRLVAAGVAVTTVSPMLAAALPPGVHAVTVRGDPQEERRVLLARRPAAEGPGVDAVADALRAAAGALRTAREV